MYRPGEEVHLKGWVRRVGGGPASDAGLRSISPAKVAFTLADSRGNEVTKGELGINALGGFDTVLKLPAGMNLGNANVTLDLQGTSLGSPRYAHSFQVQEFRRPEYEVTAQTPDGPFF